jgi:hypothetical protein
VGGELRENGDTHHFRPQPQQRVIVAAGTGQTLTRLGFSNANNGAAEFDYYNAMALRTATLSPNLFRSGAAASHASFNDIYAPLNPGAQGQAFTATTYRVAEGDLTP